MPLEANEIEAGSKVDSAPKVRASGKTRLLTLDGLDRRTAAYRETRKLIDEIEGDLGGSDRLSTGERQLVQRAAVLGAVLTDTESRWIEGEPIDIGGYCTTVNAQRRVLETVGLSRRPRDVSTDLTAYLASKTLAGSVAFAVPDKPASVAQDSGAGVAELDDIPDPAERASEPAREATP
jgi:hypothetical protein